MNIKPSRSSYVAKIIDSGNLMELHLDKSGKITSIETANDEFNWGDWSTDTDDQ